MTTTFDAIFDAVTEAIREQLRNGHRQQDLAEELKISPTMIRFIQQGTRRAGRKTVATVLKANPEWLPKSIEELGP